MMLILQVVSFLLIGLLLMSMLAKVRSYIKPVFPGKPLQTIPLGLLPKFLVHRSALLALLTGLVVGVAGGWMTPNLAAISAVFALGVVLMPMRYTLTTKGVAVGQGTFYPWSEFSGFKVEKSNLELAHPSLFGRLTLFVKPAEMDNVLKCVQRHVKIQSSNLSPEGE